MKTRIFTTLALLTLVSFVTTPTQAALLEGSTGADVLIGHDDDNVNNPVIHPPGTAANQSLDDADVLLGNRGNDVLIGLRGSDVIHGDAGNDIIIGGTEGGTNSPKSDIMYGGEGDDISIWAGGDGSDAFIGGPGRRDALVFATIDRVNNVPTLTEPVRGFPHGIPTATATGQNGFCTLERVPEDSELGYAFLVRFFSKANGALLVTVRVADDVEQVFCTSQSAAVPTFADLTDADPHFVEVTLDQVSRLNRTVGQIIR
jgi:hypothetical protein